MSELKTKFLILCFSALFINYNNDSSDDTIPRSYDDVRTDFQNLNSYGNEVKYIISFNENLNGK